MDLEKMDLERWTKRNGFGGRRWWTWEQLDLQEMNFKEMKIWGNLDL